MLPKYSSQAPPKHNLKNKMVEKIKGIHKLDLFLAPFIIINKKENNKTVDLIQIVVIFSVRDFL